MQWVTTSLGVLPDGAIVAGYESDGAPLYVARAHHERGLHIGKTRPEFGGANIPYGGTEITIHWHYEVLCM